MQIEEYDSYEDELLFNSSNRVLKRPAFQDVSGIRSYHTAYLVIGPYEQKEIHILLFSILNAVNKLGWNLEPAGKDLRWNSLAFSNGTGVGIQLPVKQFEVLCPLKV